MNQLAEVRRALRGKNSHSARLKRHVLDVKRAGLLANAPESLASVVDTGTSQASASTWEGQPEGRGLDYEPGHSPEGLGEALATLKAAGLYGTVGWVHDAQSPGGFLYGLMIGVPEAFERGADKQDAAMAAEIRRGLPRGQA